MVLDAERSINQWFSQNLIYLMQESYAEYKPHSKHDLKITPQSWKQEKQEVSYLDPPPPLWSNTTISEDTFKVAIHLKIKSSWLASGVACDIGANWLYSRPRTL